MKTIEINGHLREAVGGNTSKQLRREGHVPCVLYGGEKNLHFSAEERELNKLVFTPDVYLIKIHIGDSMVQAVLREAQYHPVEDNILHMDFVEAVPGKPVRIKIPVVLTGNAIGVKNGGVLRRNAKKLWVRGSVDDMPDVITIDITNMRIGTSVKVGELDVDGVEMLESPNRVVVAIKTSRKAIEEEEEDEELEGEEGAEGEESAAAEGAEGEGGGEEKKEE